ncbi:GOLPH3/VPS74 family protein [Solicola sp. PLA-1-18]|uniref:GOLPH3/VPS74 family protein n=1 Tax=Solicola sp. PLA-1-18 TaxID=3380532 RepID=UPI003B824B91
MLIAEDLLLLLTDDETGKVASMAPVDTGIGGALLVDLARAGRVTFSGKPKKPVVHVVDEAPPGHPVLDEALRRLAEKTDEKAEAAVDRIGRKASVGLYETLAARGVVRREAGKVLGLFPTTTWPAVDSAAEREVREELHAALVQGATPTERAAALASLLLALDQLGLVVERPDRKEAKRRAKQIAEGDAVGDGVQAAVQAAQTAAILAISVASTVTVASSGS